MGAELGIDEGQQPRTVTRPRAQERLAANERSSRPDSLAARRACQRMIFEIVM